MNCKFVNVNLSILFTILNRVEVYLVYNVDSTYHTWYTIPGITLDLNYAQTGCMRTNENSLHNSSIFVFCFLKCSL